MPYELFWKGSIDAFDHYAKKAYLESLRNDQQAWTQGLYILDAIGHALSDKHKYPEEPFLIKKEKEQKQNEADKTIKLYKNLKNWSAGVKARLNNTPPE